LHEGIGAQRRATEVHIVFADSRRVAEEWTYRFLTTALADKSDPGPTETPETPTGAGDLAGTRSVGILDPYSHPRGR
jgi:hypothetical protein